MGDGPGSSPWGHGDRVGCSPRISDVQKVKRLGERKEGSWEMSMNA